jgi:predicted amidohydrolase YtcJ
VKFDVVLTDANVLTMDEELPLARWVAIAHGRIMALGRESSTVPGANRVLSLGGATVLPGFHDAHNHTVMYGASLGHIDLSGADVSTLDQLYSRVATAASQQPTGSWIVGESYDQNPLGGHPDLEALDRAAPHHRVRLVHKSRHMCMVNSVVIDQVGLAGLSDPPGGAIKRDASGRPTGLLLENAMELIRPLTWPMSMEEMIRAIGAAHDRYLTEGITAVQEAGVGQGLAGSSPVEALAFQRAREEGRLRVRTTLMPVNAGAVELGGTESDDAFGFGLGVRTGFGDVWLRLGPMKIFSDGSLIGRSAAMTEPYADDSSNRGMLAMDESELRDTILSAHRSGWQIATHAIGDLAVDTVLDAYEAALQTLPRSDHRHRIEHAGLTSERAVSRMAALGVIPSPQGRFVGEIGDGMINALGPERINLCYRARSFLDAGIELPASSDRPVVDGAPLRGIHDLVNRQTDSGRELSRAEALSAGQALRAYTYGSAYATFAESEMGSLRPGKLADMAVLAEDPTSIDPVRIRDIEVIATLLGGRVVYGPDEMIT